MRSLFLTTALLTAASAAHAQEQAPKPAEQNEARATIADLSKIVNPNGVQESFKTRIGGIDQWLYVRGQERSNPIILFVHGGPASPMSPTMWQFQRPIEEYFTVVQWDQRAAGKTYLETNPDSISDSIKIDRYVSDAIEVTEYINRRYGTRKVVLIGHSWGTIIGLNAALRRPDLFFAYVGIGQVINIRDNERLSYDYAVTQARKAGNDTALKELESIAPYPGNQPITTERIIIARKWAQHYGGLSAFRSSSDYYFAAPLLSPEYGEREVAAIGAGNEFTLGRVLPEFLNV
ncbi:MAG TPA: alpha/beta hydrolase, partial [Nitrospiraceae bacterium]|nr:alpha/beta hydrolase [Nitrospiraceae bacterium]